MTSSSHDLTQLLVAWGEGDRAALEQLTPLVEAELHRLARHYMARERRGHTLQTTALVNEVYLRLIDRTRVRWQNRAHFFGVSAYLMRRILVDYARKRGYQKRAGAALTVSLSDATVAVEERGIDLVALDEALTRFSKLDARKSEVVELRFFAGLTVEETAEVLNVSRRTVIREWSLAQAWLYRELRQAERDDA